MDLFTVFLVLCMAISGSSRILDVSNMKSFNVMEFGAIAYWGWKNRQYQSWEAVCEATDGTPTLDIPKGSTFLLKPIKFNGPCKSANINVQIQGNIIAPSELSDWTGLDKDNWIVFSDVNGLTVSGGGKIDGQGTKWWQSCGINEECTATAFRLSGCKNAQLKGLTHINSQKNHISISSCDTVTISNLNIFAPSTSPNTDGIDIASSTNIQILDSNIGTGDDCIAINGGCANINITRLACGPGHGISIGSLGRNGHTDTVEEVHVKNCSFNATQNGARIKTWQGGSGFARKISFEDITLIAADNPIVIDQFYCPHQSCNNQSSAVQVSDVSYIGVYGTTIRENAINLSCSEGIGCTNIVLEHINIKSAIGSEMTQSFCQNAHGRSIDTFPKAKCLLP